MPGMEEGLSSGEEEAGREGAGDCKSENACWVNEAHMFQLPCREAVVWLGDFAYRLSFAETWVPVLPEVTSGNNCSVDYSPKPTRRAGA